jgi:hypothetical protein
MMAAALVNAASMSAKLMIVSGRLSKVSPTMLMTVAATSAFQTPGRQLTALLCRGPAAGAADPPSARCRLRFRGTLVTAAVTCLTLVMHAG